MSGEAQGAATAYEHGGGYQQESGRALLRRFLIGLAVMGASFVAIELNAGVIWGSALTVGWLAFELLSPRRRPQRLRDYAPLVLVAAYSIALLFVRLYPDEPSRTAHMIRDGIVLIFCVGGLAASVRFVVTRWYDDEALADWLGSTEGYIARPRRVSVRVEAVLNILTVAAMTGVLVYLTLTTPFDGG